MRSIPSILSVLLVTQLASQNAWPDSDASHWLELSLKDRTIAVHPTTGEQREAPDLEPRGIRSPDGSKIAFIATERESGRHTDLFVADLDPAQPSGKAEPRRITTTQQRPMNPHWFPDNRRLVFLALVNGANQLFIADALAGKEPTMLSRGEHFATRPQVLADGRIAYLQMVRREGKAQYHDLHVLTLSPNGNVPIKDQILIGSTDIFGYALSPDASQLVHSTPG